MKRLRDILINFRGTNPTALSVYDVLTIGCSNLRKFIKIINETVRKNDEYELFDNIKFSKYQKQSLGDKPDKTLNRIIDTTWNLRRDTDILYYRGVVKL